MVDPVQAKVVKRIFTEVLAGKGAGTIAADLNDDGIPAQRCDHWTSTSILGMLTNERYVGDTLLQKTFTDEQFNRHRNTGEMDMYCVQGLVAQNTEQRETLTRLMAQGYIDQVLYSRENNGLLAQCEEFRAEIETLKKSQTTDAVQTAETEKLLKFVEKAEIQEEWNSDLFRQFVESIMVYSRNEIGFVLKCGLTLRERI